MATEGVPRIEVDDDRAHVTDVGITDSVVVEYLQQFDDEREREDTFIRALRVGVTPMDLAETSQQEEYVERKFTEMQRDLQEEIGRIEEEVEEKFGDDGHVPQIFEDLRGQVQYGILDIQQLERKLSIQATYDEYQVRLELPSGRIVRNRSPIG